MLNQIKKSFNKMIKTQRKYCEQYKGTFILIILTTLVIFFTTTEKNLFQKQILILIFSIILIFTVENIFIEKNKKRIGYILSIFLAIISYYMLLEQTPTNKTIMSIIGFYIINIIISIYFITKKTDLANYLIQYIQNKIIYEIIQSIIQIGVLFILIIADVLLLNHTNEMLYIKAEILVIGFIMIPGNILCLVNINEKKTDVIQSITKYIILPIILISETIIYIYFLKMIISLNIPNNEIYRIIACLFIVTYPTWIILEKNEKKDIFIKISKYLTYSFIPLIILQSYAIGIRIIQNGITITRYLGIIYLIFEISAITISIYKKEKKNIILIITGVLVFISTIMPYSNAIELSYYSQLNRIKKVYPIKESINNLTNKEQKQLISSYKYIKNTLDLEKRLPKYIKESGKEWDRYNIENENIEKESEKIIDYVEDEINIDIKEYNRLKKISFSYYKKQTIDNITIKELDNKQWQESFQKQIEKYIKQEYIDSPWIKLDNNTSIYTTYIYISYKDKEIKDITLEGYLLAK